MGQFQTNGAVTSFQHNWIAGNTWDSRQGSRGDTHLKPVISSISSHLLIFWDKFCNFLQFPAIASRIMPVIAISSHFQQCPVFSSISIHLKTFPAFFSHLQLFPSMVLFDNLKMKQCIFPPMSVNGQEYTEAALGCHRHTHTLYPHSLKKKEWVKINHLTIQLIHSNVKKK